jgi:hypothetical protein
MNGSGSNPLKKNSPPLGEGNIRIRGFDPPPNELPPGEMGKFRKFSIC